MIGRKEIEHIVDIVSGRMRNDAIRALSDYIADLETTAMLANTIHIGTKARGQTIEPSEAIFRESFRHTSTVNGQPIIAYDLLASALNRAHEQEPQTQEQINAENKAFARQLNSNMADELKRLNQR